MEKAQIVPQILSEVPNQYLEVKYGKVGVKRGNHLTPLQVQDPPTVVMWGAEPEKYYSLCMIGPDVLGKSIGVLGEFLHWLVMDIPGSKVNQGKVYAEYRGAGPRRWTGTHRYIFVVYEQPKEFVTIPEKKLDKDSIIGRLRFSLQDFSTKYQLGNPIGGNFFESQYIP